ncbi:MAG TPA: oxidoreductase [Rhizomicrobium sp.]
MSQVWLITGSSRGLGRAMAEAVLRAGHRLVATARRPEELDSLVKLYGEQIRAVALDVTDPAAAQGAVDVAIAGFGRLDVLVNNAGYGNLAPVEDTSLEDFRAQIEANLFGTIIVTKAALPVMRRQRGGHVIQVSSVGGRIGPIGRGAYAAAKWGVEGFSETLAKEVEAFGIKVTIVEPGGFRTDFAGSSTSIREGSADYAGTVGVVARFQRDFDGKQPGDPARAAAIILGIAEMEKPPMRLVLGRTAYEGVEKNDAAKLAELRAWRETSLSADFEASS